MTCPRRLRYDLCISCWRRLICNVFSCLQFVKDDETVESAAESGVDDEGRHVNLGSASSGDSFVGASSQLDDPAVMNELVQSGQVVLGPPPNSVPVATSVEVVQTFVSKKLIF
jgi:hypothetical protein